MTEINLGKLFGWHSQQLSGGAAKGSPTPAPRLIQALLPDGDVSGLGGSRGYLKGVAGA